MSSVSRQIKISGKVQGVFFRASAKSKADGLNIKGFVRNETNGDVYIEAEGNEDDVTSFVNWCKHGPYLARVEQCEIVEGTTKGFKDFVISR